MNQILIKITCDDYGGEGVFASGKNSSLRDMILQEMNRQWADSLLQEKKEGC